MKNVKAVCLFVGLMIAFQGAWADGAKNISAKKVPTAVKDAFKAKFPDAKLHEWEMEEGNYVASFSSKDARMEAAFTPDGKWKETELKSKMSEVPQAIKDALAKSEYAKWKVGDVAKIATPENPNMFEIEVHKGNECYGLHYDLSGKLVKKEKE